jgi:hypothetical protein
VEYRELWPRTDLHAIMAAAQQRLAAEGWTVDTISKNSSFFFAARAADNAFHRMYALETAAVFGPNSWGNLLAKPCPSMPNRRAIAL